MTVKPENKIDIFTLRQSILSGIIEVNFFRFGSEQIFRCVIRTKDIKVYTIQSDVFDDQYETGFLVIESVEYSADTIPEIINIGPELEVLSVDCYAINGEHNEIAKIEVIFSDNSRMSISADAFPNGLAVEINNRSYGLSQLEDDQYRLVSFHENIYHR